MLTHPRGTHCPGFDELDEIPMPQARISKPIIHSFKVAPPVSEVYASSAVGHEELFRGERVR
jgi:hypothetical protein